MMHSGLGEIGGGKWEVSNLGAYDVDARMRGGHSREKSQGTANAASLHEISKKEAVK
jgi:hypothetical protein